jgi:non-specific serine/threonine protein kinase/serine/threonine-protein kinase
MELTPATWKVLSEMLDQGLELPEDERAQWMDGVHRDHPELGPALRKLMAAHSAAERNAALDTLPSVEPPASSREGQHVGVYQLVRRIGAGGMGEVWLADQVVPVRRHVAVKLIKAGMDTRQVVARFESERQALALMDHPAIARVLDAGSTPEGRPFFAMEYVDGVSITSFCDERRLSTEERLALFVRVCEGVQHAHQKAILHRDLKPSNVLVVESDGEPLPKIIDFGIAKALGRESLSAQTLLTEVGALVGTPEYMSPEQADPASPALDTRSDIYSLGVMLYELLTGSLPFPAAELRASSQEEIRRILRDVDPPRPSSRVATLGDAVTTVASRRQTDPGFLRRALRGDLDAIVLKAMEKDPSRRYAAASELAADLRRHLRHEPVIARAPSNVYRAAKYVRRHRLGVGVAATLAVLLIGFAASTSVQARRIARERDRANAEAARAGREAAAARRVSQFLTSMFKVSDPDEARGNTITAREVLDRGMVEVETALAQEPELRAQMQETMGEVYGGLGLSERARGLLERSLETRRAILGPEAPETLESTRKLAGLLRADGKLAEANSLIRRNIEVASRTLGPDSPETLRSMTVLAWTLADEGKLAEAEALARKTIDDVRRVQGPKDRDTLDALGILSIVLNRQRRFAENEAIDREMLALEEETLGSDHPDTLLDLQNVAGDMSNQGRFTEAEPLFRDLVSRLARVFGPDHRQTLLAKQNLGITLKFAHRFSEAEVVTAEVLETRRRLLGPEHPETLASMLAMAIIYKDQKRFAEAERIGRETLETRRRILGPSHPETANAKYDLACTLALAGKRSQALELLRDSLEHGLTPASAAAIDQDSDFAPLHGDPRFAQLVAEGKRLAASSGSGEAGAH